MDPTKPISDPLAMVRGLDAETIRKQIDKLDAERNALMTLLRIAKRTQSSKPREAVPCAD